MPTSELKSNEQKCKIIGGDATNFDTLDTWHYDKFCKQEILKTKCPVHTNMSIYHGFTKDFFESYKSRFGREPRPPLVNDCMDLAICSNVSFQPYYDDLDQEGRTYDEKKMRNLFVGATTDLGYVRNYYGV